jgi:hypothetical protein
MRTMRTLVLRLLVLSCTLVVVAYGAAFARGGTPVWAPWLLAVGANGMILSMMALGAMRRDRLPRVLAWIFVALFVLCAGSFLLALALPAAEGVGGPLLLGLPLRTAIVLYGVGVVPIAILPFAYALTFDASTLSEEDLRRAREAYARVRDARDAS